MAHADPTSDDAWENNLRAKMHAKEWRAGSALEREGMVVWTCCKCGIKGKDRTTNTNMCEGVSDVQEFAKVLSWRDAERRICCNCWYSSEERRGRFNERACSKCKKRRASWGGATTLEKYNQAKSKQDAGFSFYHATTLESALQIQEAGFRVPTGPSEQKAGALLGSGVYCTVTLQKAMKYCDGPHGGIIFELAVDLGKCKTLGENDPMMTTWQQHGYDSAWAPTGAGGRGAGLEENCIKDPKRIKIKQAIAGHSYQLR